MYAILYTDTGHALTVGRAIGARFPLDWPIFDGSEIPAGYEPADVSDLPPGVQVVRRTEAAELEALQAEAAELERQAAAKRARIGALLKR